jgi:hypothetical protein
MATNLEWVPCRYSPLGWKYQVKGSTNKHLNHPNKKNVVGFSSANDEEGLVKESHRRS